MLVVLTLGCDGEPTDLVEREPPDSIVTMSYNLAGAVGGTAGRLAEHIGSVGPDFVAAQECAECTELLERLPPKYALTAAPRAGVAIIFDNSKWEARDGGSLRLGNNDDLWGERVAVWAELVHRSTHQRQYLYSTHWCATARSADDDCDAARQLEYTEALLDHVSCRANDYAPALIAGDLNVFDGFEDGVVIQALIASGLTDVFRQAHPNEDATTFEGNDWAPAGRLDYIFATGPLEVLAASIERDAIPPGQGSDHAAVLAETLFPQ